MGHVAGPWSAPAIPVAGADFRGAAISREIDASRGGTAATAALERRTALITDCDRVSGRSCRPNITNPAYARC
ncbi:hypothetical protein GCM10027444_14870 [Actinopolyspora lacussalsi]